ncbi:MAG: hypothetical protein J6336_13055 [Kiritimatiellae bacterium]|nr:hypothetical protein [Kiritimatiellia bacterium]
MKNPAHMVMVAITLAAAGALAQTLEEGFSTPPHEAKPHTWYHMMNGNVTKAGITADFEALAKAGIGGVQMFDAGCDVPAGPVKFNSDEWFDLFRHAQKEAKRLGLEICIPNCSGWSSSGGPWNKPDNAMKDVTFTETAVKGPSVFNGKLPRTQDDHGFYEDIAVLAYPTPKSGAKLENLEKKIFRWREIAGLMHNRDRNFFDPTSKKQFPADQLVDATKEIDLTKAMQPDGSLNWNVPAGEWTILRIGYRCNGQCNGPASDFGRGLEVDKLSAPAMDYHFEQYVSRLCRDLGVSSATDNTLGFNNILVDSYEVQCQNWTQGFDRAFERRFGYPLLKYLPVFAGRVVGSVEESERFLEDFRRLIGELFAKNYSGRMAELCHQHGLRLSIEPYGNCTCDDLDYGESVDIPMGEFWSHMGDPGNAKLAASLIHVWGRKYAGTESFTGSPFPDHSRWLETPWKIKWLGDQAFAKGINRIIYHRFTHQPWPGDDFAPGMTMGRWGMHFDRKQTWWRHVNAWLTYQARCQWMLQQGVFRADVLQWTGEQVPNENSWWGVGVPSGYDWDIASTRALMRLTVKNGKVVVPGGTEYALLALPNTATMSETALIRIGELIDQGAKVCAIRKPNRHSGLVGWPAADAKIAALADRIWAKGVISGTTEKALEQLGITPDFTHQAQNAPVAWIHRSDADADIYFVSAGNSEPLRFDASFRQSGRVPELWNAETGERTDAAVWRMEKGRTVVSLDLPPKGSTFVVFRRPATDTVHLTRATVKVIDPPATNIIGTIIEAHYGALENNRFLPGATNVTSILRNVMRKGRVSLMVGNETFNGDPFFGKVKTCRVTYELAGEKYTKDFPELSRVNLNLNYSTSRMEVINAVYGAYRKSTDGSESAEFADGAMEVTGVVKGLVKNGRLDFTVRNEQFGDDPALGNTKFLRLTYTVDGEERTEDFMEGMVLRLPDALAEDFASEWEWKNGALVAWNPVTVDGERSDGQPVHQEIATLPPMTVTGPWNVKFISGRGAPEAIEFPRLVRWNRHTDARIKFYSGTAIYSKRIALPANAAGKRIAVDLGEVRDFAVVRVNGKTFRTLWKPPFSVDVTDAIDPGKGTFDLEVEVTNLWPNRFLGDEILHPDDCDWIFAGDDKYRIKQLPEWSKQGRPSPTHRRAFSTWKHWIKGDPLIDSGLLGPVTVRFGTVESVK